MPPVDPWGPWASTRCLGASSRIDARTRTHRGTWANVGRGYGADLGGVAGRDLGSHAARAHPGGTTGDPWRPWRRRTGRGWWASHHRRGLPRPPKVRELERRTPGSVRQPVREASRGGPSSRMRPAPRGSSALMPHPTGETPQNGRNSAACTQSRGAVSRNAGPPRVYPTPVGRRALRRVARPTEHRAVGDVERGTASGERHDVIDGQVAGSVGIALVARAPVPVLATPGPEHAGAEALPGPRAVQGVVAAAVRLSGVRRCSDCRVGSSTPQTVQSFTARAACARCRI